jgi:hypothetical protein
MDRKSSLFLLVSQATTLAACLFVMYHLHQSSERLPVLLGWAVASLNFTAAVTLKLKAMRKDFEAFKFAVFAGSGVRMGLMLAVLFVILKCKPLWSASFSFSLLSCFGIYIMLEVLLFFKKSKRPFS